MHQHAADHRVDCTRFLKRVGCARNNFESTRTPTLDLGQPTLREMINSLARQSGHPHHEVVVDRFSTTTIDHRACGQLRLERHAVLTQQTKISRRTNAPRHLECNGHATSR